MAPRRREVLQNLKKKKGPNNKEERKYEPNKFLMGEMDFFNRIQIRLRRDRGLPIHLRSQK
jgi:hypothetical protein